MSVLTITKDNFEEQVLHAEGTVLVDFWASWCGPCRMLSPIVDEIAEDGVEGLTVGKINVDEQPELAAAFDVMTIPTLIIFKNGEVATNSVGVKPKQAILDMLR